MKRRDLLVGAAAGLGLSSPAAARRRTRSRKHLWKGRKGMIPILDTHQHLWDLDKFQLPWLSGGGPLATSHVMSDYLKAAEGLNVVKTIYMEVDVHPSQLVAEAEYVFDFCRRSDNPMVGAVIGGRPSSELFRPYLDRFKGEPHLKGVRQVLHTPATPAGYCVEEAFVAGVRLLGERNLSFDLCVPGDALDSAAQLVDACPGTRFILDHCGNANVQQKERDAWKKGIDAVAKRKNVVCKISGIVASADPKAWSADDLAPIVLHCAEAFGRDRLIFASDWPVCTLVATLRQWVEALGAIVSAWPEADRRKLFHDNAAKFYGV